MVLAGRNSLPRRLSIVAQRNGTRVNRAAVLGRGDAMRVTTVTSHDTRNSICTSYFILTSP
jgi:hypothetical protein